MNTSKPLRFENPEEARQKILDNCEVAFLPKARECPGPCWRWLKCSNDRGYGHCCIFPKKPAQLAHRVSYAAFVEPLLEGMEVDHICENTCCVNPEHLKQKTTMEHSQVKSLQNKTHCARGHLLAEVGFYSKKRTGGRNGVNNTCAACHRLTRQRYEAKKKSQQQTA